MVTHIVLWQLKDEGDKREAAGRIKRMLEELVGQVPGLLEARVYQGFEGFDVALISRHENREALAIYQDHPAHLLVKGYIQSVTCNRASCDFEA